MLDASEIISDIFKFESEKLTIVALSALIWVIIYNLKKQNYIAKIIQLRSKKAGRFEKLLDSLGVTPL